jgi:hypothetical protein
MGGCETPVSQSRVKTSNVRYAQRMEARVLYSPFDDAVVAVGCRVTAWDAFGTSKPRIGANSVELTASLSKAKSERSNRFSELIKC